MNTLKHESPDTLPPKIRESLNYLENSNLNISEIAYYLGFKSNYFTKKFKKEMGKSPKQYRKDMISNSNVEWKDFNFICKCNKVISDHYMSPDYDVKKLASDLCVSNSTLYRKIQINFGTSPKAFLNNTRMTLAVQLLLDKNEKLSSIVEKVGFNDTYYFSKTFKKNFGCKPSEFSKKNNKKEIYPYFAI